MQKTTFGHNTKYVPIQIHLKFIFEISQFKLKVPVYYQLITTLNCYDNPEKIILKT